MRLRTIGRRSGQERAAILGYFEDGPNLVTLAMNGWADPDPAWWLNLQSHPEAVVELRGGSPCMVRGRAAEGEERTRLLERFHDYHGWGDDLTAFTSLRSQETAVVVLEPRA
jgi:deazaflavin-dependent oxidoreductase (nitroreductase family)